MLQQSEEQQQQVLGERDEQQNAKTHDNRVTMARVDTSAHPHATTSYHSLCTTLGCLKRIQRSLRRL